LETGLVVAAARGTVAEDLDPTRQQMRQHPANGDIAAKRCRVPVPALIPRQALDGLDTGLAHLRAQWNDHGFDRAAGLHSLGDDVQALGLVRLPEVGGETDDLHVMRGHPVGHGAAVETTRREERDAFALELTDVHVSSRSRPKGAVYPMVPCIRQQPARRRRPMAPAAKVSRVPALSRRRPRRPGRPPRQPQHAGLVRQPRPRPSRPRRPDSACAILYTGSYGYPAATGEGWSACAPGCSGARGGGCSVVGMQNTPTPGGVGVFWKDCSAVTYSPTRPPGQYHRR